MKKSLREIAKELEISPSYLSNILNEKKRLFERTYE